MIKFVNGAVLGSSGDNTRKEIIRGGGGYMFFGVDLGSVDGDKSAVSLICLTSSGTYNVVYSSVYEAYDDEQEFTKEDWDRMKERLVNRYLEENK